MTANFESLTPAKSMGMNIPKLVTALNKGSGANWSLSRSRKSTGKWAEKDMDHVLELAQPPKCRCRWAAWSISWSRASIRSG